jgi:serine protease Do
MPYSNVVPFRRVRQGVAALALSGALIVGTAAIPVLPAHAAPAPESFAPLVNKVKGAVVNIATTQLQQGARANELPDMPDFPPGSPFGELFKNLRPEQQRPEKLRALGSGFIIDPAGYVVTNNHVVGNATDISVTLTDGTILKGKLVGHDEKTDLALVKVSADHPLPYVSFGNSDQAQVGDWVLAVGNPFGLGGSVTAGIVSARGRDIHSGPYDDYLQVDAAINRGNSGGPTFNTNGDVIGINTAIYSPTGGSVGIGFAIPSNVAQPVIAQLKSTGKVERGWLGVQIQPVTPDMANALGLKSTHGALVAAVQPNSPADKAGLKQGDVVVRFAGADVDSPRDLSRAVAAVHAGTSQAIQVMRDGQTTTLNTTIAQSTEQTEKSFKQATAEEAGKGKLGLRLAPLNDQTRESLDLPDGIQGVVITNVDPNSAAAEQGLQAGDIIERVDNKPVKNPGDVAKAVRTVEKSGRKSVAMLINRQGSQQFVAVPLGNA